jgi:hypothetical protein
MHTTIDDLIPRLLPAGRETEDRVREHLSRVLAGGTITNLVRLDNDLIHVVATGGWKGKLHWMFVVQAPNGGRINMVEMLWEGAGATTTVQTRCCSLAYLTEIEITEEYEGLNPTTVGFTFHFELGKPFRLNSGEITPDQLQASGLSMPAARIAEAWNFAQAVQE